mmetsp:Transcript_10392/g.30020  ORF Transcript_10392/g.30020 Transcript_10392/m.30020 type:complete len:81 (+) Transcript_10392:626-868(+)
MCCHSEITKDNHTHSRGEDTRRRANATYLCVCVCGCSPLRLSVCATTVCDVYIDERYGPSREHGSHLALAQTASGTAQAT